MPNFDGSQRKGCFVIVDAQNLYHSAKELFGRGARIDFKKLRSRLVEDRDFMVVYSVAFMPELREDTNALARALFRMGYEVIPRVSEFSVQLEQLFSTAQRFDLVCIGSGDSAFLPLVKQIKAASVPVEVFAFADSSSVDLRSLADRFVYLKTDVLIGDFPTLEAQVVGVEL